jgi:hypothetical protein
MLTVDADVKGVEAQLVGGWLVCPLCLKQLGPWGWARGRTVGRGDRRVWLRPRRSQCRGCLVTHVLLPAVVLLRRADLVEVIGDALVRRARGAAVRVIAKALKVPRSTVAGWLIRFGSLAERLRGDCTRWAVWLDPVLVRLEPAGSQVGDAVVAIVAAGQAAVRQLGAGSVWAFASAATGGRLLGNTSAAFPAPWQG